jgi:hypothetical protein
MDGYVYAIKRDDRVKIGWSMNPTRRAAELRCGELVGCVKATPAQERELHLLLSRYRIEGEWFHWCKAVEKLCSMLGPPPVVSLDWDEIDRKAEALGVSYWARQKWKQRGAVPVRFAHLAGLQP